MKNVLLESLLTFYMEDPADPFNIYALALEYSKTDSIEAGKYFEKLLAEHAGYLPTYYHAGELFIQLGDLAKAEGIYKKGIGIALNQGNNKTHQELVRAYRNLLDELED